MVELPVVYVDNGYIFRGADLVNLTLLLSRPEPCHVFVLQDGLCVSSMKRATDVVN